MTMASIGKMKDSISRVLSLNCGSMIFGILGLLAFVADVSSLRLGFLNFSIILPPDDELTVGKNIAKYIKIVIYTYIPQNMILIVL